MNLSPKMLAVLVFLGGLVVIAYQVYELDKFRREMWAMKPLQVEPPKQIGSSNFIMLGGLAKEHLMGNPYPQPTKSAEQKPVVNTNLKLELVGTIRGAGTNEKDSALIRSKDKASKRYYVGEQIEGGAVLDSVNEDSIILKRGASLETLHYTKEGFATVPTQVLKPPSTK